MADFVAGVGEELRIVVLADQYDLSSVTDMTVLRHGGNPTGPHKPNALTESEDVATDLQVADNVSTGFTAAAGYSADYRYGAHDIPQYMCAGDAWSAAVTIADTDIASTVAGGVNKFTSATADKFNALSTMVPCPVYIVRDGASPLATYAIALSVVTGGSPELVIGKGTASGSDVADGHFGVSLGTVAAGDNVTIYHSGVLDTGNTEYYALFERAQDAIGQYRVLDGAMCIKDDLTQSKGSIGKIAFDFAGLDVRSGTATYGTGTETAATNFPVFDMGTGFRYFGIGGLFRVNDPSDATAGFFPKSCNRTVTSNGNPVDAMGVDGLSGNFKDTVMVNGSFELFSNDAAATITALQEAGTETSLFWVNSETSGGVTSAYAHWLLRITFEDNDQQNGGKGNVVSSSFPWKAARHPTYLKTYVRTRFAALPS